MFGNCILLFALFMYRNYELKNLPFSAMSCSSASVSSVKSSHQRTRVFSLVPYRAKSNDEFITALEGDYFYT